MKFALRIRAPVSCVVVLWDRATSTQPLSICLILTSFLPCLFCFVSPPLCPADSEDDGESEAAKQLIQPIAEKIIAKYKAKEEEAPLLFFVAGEVSGKRAQGCILLCLCKRTELGWLPLLPLFRWVN